MGKPGLRPRLPKPTRSGEVGRVAAAQHEFATEIERLRGESEEPFEELVARAAMTLASNHGVGRPRLLELAAQAPEEGFEYRSLPAFGTSEFAAEIARRKRNPGRLHSVEDAIADLSD